MHLLEVFRDVGPVITGTIAIAVAAFVYISGRNKERRDRRLAALENAQVEVAAVNEKYFLLLSLRSTLPAADSKIHLQLWEKVAEFQQELRHLSAVIVRLELLGYVGVANVVASVA